MTAIRDLARELKLTERVRSGRTVARAEIAMTFAATCRTAPAVGQMIAFVTDRRREAHPPALPRPARQSERADLA